MGLLKHDLLTLKTTTTTTTTTTTSPALNEPQLQLCPPSTASRQGVDGNVTSTYDEVLSKSRITQSNTTTRTTTTTIAKPTFEIVTTILHQRRQSKKRKQFETADWLLSPYVQDIPVAICSPDKLVNLHAAIKKGPNARHFRPEEDHVFGRLLANNDNHNNRTGAVTILPMLNGKHASEVPGYLRFILHNWNDLPDVVIFLHAIPEAHDINGNLLKNIRHVIDNWTPQQIGFLNVNDHIMICRKSHGPGGSWWKYWEILGFDRNHIPRRLKLPCCAQFMVSKERILLRPKWFYQQALKLAYETEDAVFFEHFFQIIWGEQALLSPDRELRTYVRSNWTKPVLDAVLHNPYPNEPYSDSMKPWYEKAMADPDAYYPKVQRSKKACPPGDEYWYD